MMSRVAKFVLVMFFCMFFGSGLCMVVVSCEV